MAETLERNADSFDSISASIDAMGLKSKQFFVGFLGQIDDLVRYWLDRFEQLDFTSAGEKAGALVQLVKQKFREGQLTEFIELVIAAGVEYGLNKLNDLIDWFSGNGPFLRQVLESSQYVTGQIFLFVCRKGVESID